ncbi:MAG: glycosyltransferase family 4 protein [Steroidobacteraceae bacterium]
MTRRALEFLVPGDLRAATGGYVYDRRMIAGLRALGWQVTVHTLEASFPEPTSAALAHAHRTLASLPAHALVLIDGLALSAMPEVLRAYCAQLELVALIHMPLAAEVGVAPELARGLQLSEREALHTVRHVIVTGRACRPMLLAYGLEPQHISVVEPGTDEAPLALQRPDAIVKMLCVGTVNPGKGHDLLIEALGSLAPLPWHLTCVGSLTRRPQTVSQLRSQLQRLGLSERVTLAGEVESSELARFYLDADLFVLPTRFESYCMAVAEALAHGLPVLSTHTGAIPDLVGTEAGVLVEPGDIDALREALTRLLCQPALRANLARGAAAVRERLPRWSAACARLALVLERIQAGNSVSV